MSTTFTETVIDAADLPVTATYYTVVWGLDSSARICYTDSGDGSVISETANDRATAKFLEFCRAGTPAAFYINDQLEIGTDLFSDIKR